jgi:hypothetical protein
VPSDRNLPDSLGPTGRVIAAGALAGLAVGLLVFRYQVGHLEADAAAHVYALATPTAAAPRAPIIWFGAGTPDAFGLVITSGWNSLLLVAPLCGLCLALILPRQRLVRRVATAIAAASAVMIAGNLLRIEVIAMAIRFGGTRTGYRVGQVVLGPVSSVVCIALSLMLLALILSAPDGRPLISPVLRWRPRAARERAG